MAGRVTFPSNHNPGDTPQAMAVHGLERRVASQLSQDDAHVAVTARAIAGKVFRHSLHSLARHLSMTGRGLLKSSS